MYCMWILFATAMICADAVRDITNKKTLRSVDAYVMSWAATTLVFLFILPTLFFIPLPNLTKEFFFAVVAGGSLNLIALILYLNALKRSDVSLTVPFLAFTPLFLLIMSPIVLHESPSITGIVGVLLIVVGLYVINIKDRNHGFLAPIIGILQEPGPKMALGVAAIHSVTSLIDRIGINNSSPVIWVFATNVFISSCMLPIMLYKSKGQLQKIPIHWKAFFLVGGLTVLSLLSQSTALTLTHVAYVVAFKRAGIILSITLAYFLFKEQHIRERIIGAIIMVAGAILIIIS